MESSEFRVKTIAFYNPRSGVGSTTLAAFACILAANDAIGVTGASLDPKRSLMRWLVNYQGIAWTDASGPSLAPQEECDDLLVLDVSSTSQCTDILQPDLWVMPMCDRASYEAAVLAAPALMGPILWVWNKMPYPGQCAESDALRERAIVPRHLGDRVAFAEDVVWEDFAISFYANECDMAESWMTAGARAAFGLCRELLLRVRLASLQTEFFGPPSRAGRIWIMSEIEDETPTQAAGYPATYTLREHAARERLRSFFHSVMTPPTSHPSSIHLHIRAEERA